MIIDDIKKANIEAMKRKDNAARSVYSSLISRYQLLVSKDPSQPVSDADVLAMIQKVSKELDEEKDSFLKAGRDEQAKEIDAKKALLTPFLPKQLSEDEIKGIIDTLDDKSIKSVMGHFSKNYRGQVDMALVSKIAKGL